jgi:thiol-disulfide isomerase/thioredoxin
MKPILKIFITENCPGCDEALNVAAHMEQDYADVIAVEVINITDAQNIIPEAVFATPTFMLNDRIVSLGNPSPKEIRAWIEDATTLQPEP